MSIRKLAFLLTLSVSLCLVVWSALAHEGEHHSEGGNGQPGGQALAAMSYTPCVNGMAGTFPCNKVDLAAFLPLASIGGPASPTINDIANDIWGWTDQQTGKEYALIGLSNGLSFIDVSDAANPVYLGRLPTHNNVNSLWRSIKVYRDHAYVVSEAAGHGLQVFDLTRLRGVTTPQTFTETAHYNNFGSAHTINVDEETGFLYVAGSRPTAGRTPGVDTCAGTTSSTGAQRGGGLHVVNANAPASPAFAGCVSEDGYTHETECVIYRGPDATYRGREICFSSNEDTLTIVDVTNKQSPVQLSRMTYDRTLENPRPNYTHQGWLTADHTRFLLNDELDEQLQHLNTRTFIWDVSDLDAPAIQNVHQHATTAIDHNLYIRGLFAVESNYRSGVRLLDLHNVHAGQMTEVAFFDVYPVDDQALFNGTWANYPFFASGTIIASGMEQGLFVLKPQVGLPVKIDYTPFFVRQNYRDFLGREPDESGLAFWSNQIDECMADGGCTDVRRINVSAAFFLSGEFQETGYLAYKTFGAAFGTTRVGSTVPLTFQEFLADQQEIGRGVVIGQPGAEALLEANKVAYFNSFVQRPSFVAAYPQSMTAAQFVDALNANTGNSLTDAEENALATQLAQGTKTRAQVLRAVAENGVFTQREKNRAFVLMEYFGYLRRNPNEGPNTDFSGYQFWLDKLNDHGGNYVEAEMVKAFITSPEYRARFGQ